jgi:hypothetical protein
MNWNVFIVKIVVHRAIIAIETWLTLMIIFSFNESPCRGRIRPEMNHRTYSHEESSEPNIQFQRQLPANRFPYGKKRSTPEKGTDAGLSFAGLFNDSKSCVYLHERSSPAIGMGLQSHPRQGTRQL